MKNNTYTNSEVVEFALKYNKINMDAVMEEMRKRDYILSQHEAAIYQQKDGRWCTYIHNNGTRRAIRLKTREAVEQRLYEFYSGEDAARLNRKKTLRQLFDEWLEYKSLQNKSQTIKVFRSVWNTYYENSEIVDIPICELKKIDIEEWIYKMIRQYDMNKSKYNNFISVIKQELQYAVDKEIIPVSPYLSVKIDTRRVLKPKNKKADSDQVFSPEEERRFFEIGFDDYKNKLHPVNQLVPLAAMFLFCTGLRVGEVCSVKYSDISGDYITIQRFYNNSTRIVEEGLKAGRDFREVPLTEIAKELVELARIRQSEYGIDTDYIFSMSDAPTPYEAVRSIFYSYCDKIGTSRKCAHCARKTYISKLLDASVNLNTIRSIVGHASEQTTLNSYCYDRHGKQEVYRTISDAFHSINEREKCTQLYSVLN